MSYLYGGACSRHGRHVDVVVVVLVVVAHLVVAGGQLGLSLGGLVVVVRGDLARAEILWQVVRPVMTAMAPVAAGRRREQREAGVDGLHLVEGAVVWPSLSLIHI